MIGFDQKRAGRHALVESQRLLRDRGLDQSEPVDVFRVILDEGITLSFNRYKSLMGAYIPGNDDTWPLITVNQGHGLALQRYTAAHELGHHVERSTPVHDLDVEVLARGRQPRSYSEFFAESFAAWLLMPRQLVVAKLRQLGLPARELDAEGVYRLSLELGTSYDATATQLWVLRQLSAARYRALRKVPPKVTKEHLAGQTRANVRGDVWAVGDPGDNRRLRPKPGDDVMIEMPEAPGTSYEWERVGWPSDILTSVASEFSPASDAAHTYDGAGRRRVHFTVAGPGSCELRLALRSPFDPDPAETRSLLLEVEAPREGTYEVAADLAA